MSAKPIMTVLLRVKVTFLRHISKKIFIILLLRIYRTTTTKMFIVRDYPVWPFVDALAFIRLINKR